MGGPAIDKGGPSNRTPRTQNLNIIVASLTSEIVTITHHQTVSQLGKQLKLKGTYSTNRLCEARDYLTEKSIAYLTNTFI